MMTIRRAFQSDEGLGAAARRELERGSHSTSATSALEVLIDLYAGPNSRFLNFYGPARSVPTLPYDRALDGSAVGFDGKLLLVGLSEPRQPEQQDDFFSVFSQSSGVNLSGVELAATAVANLLEQRALASLPLPLQGGLILVLGIGFGIFVGRSTVLRAAGVAALAGALYFTVAYLQFASAYVWLPLVVPLLVQLPASVGVAVWWNYRELGEQRERVRTALGYYVPQSLARKLSEQTLAPGANRQLLHGTCLVTDAEQYTSVAERLPPGRAGFARQRLLPSDLSRRPRAWRRDLRYGRGFDGRRVGQQPPRRRRALARRASGARDSRCRRRVQSRSRRLALADEGWARVGRDAARQHRRRAALRVPCRRRHREHGVADSRIEPTPRDSRARFGGDARWTSSCPRATSARFCYAASGFPCV